MKLSLPLILSLIFSGCLIRSPAARIKPYNNTEVYQGYPCRDQCPAFKSGYDAAALEHLTHKRDCHGSIAAEVLGCQAYVTDYTYNTNPDPGLRL